MNDTFVAELWSDNKQIAPMLPEISYVQKCPPPLENDSIFKNSMEKGLESHPVQEKYIKNATEII